MYIPDWVIIDPKEELVALVFAQHMPSDAVATSLPLFTLTDADEVTVELELASTLVWVRTTVGWKIAHEHNEAVDTESSKAVWTAVRRAAS